MSSNNFDYLTEAKRVLELEASSILEARQRLGEGFNQACQLIRESLQEGGKLIVSGLGKSGKIGDKIAATMASTGTPALFLHPTEGLHGDLGIVQKKDVVLLLSNSGRTAELLALFPSIKRLGVKVISIVGRMESPIAKKSDIALDGGVKEEACHNNLAPTTSTTLALALGDALAMALQKERDFKPEDFAAFHPDGALGKRLTLKVSDLMVEKTEAPLVQEEASFEEILFQLNEKKLGVVLVLGASGNLSGIITDGDMRRALKFREKLFSMRASDLMTQNPISIEETKMATEALQIMENRPGKITSLVVTNSKNELLGLIHLHDLINAGI